MGWSGIEMIPGNALPLGSAGALLLAVVLFAACACAPGRADGESGVVGEWVGVAVPPAPELLDVTVSTGKTALLILDVQKSNCSAERRPRCVESLPRIVALLERCRGQGIPIVYSLTSNAGPEDIREEVRPRPDDPVVASSVDKFYGTDLEQILRDIGVEAVILVGTSAHGAVLNTATGAAMRGFEVIVPVDGMSATEAYAEQYTAWHLANSPGTRRQTRLTTTTRITIEP